METILGLVIFSTIILLGFAYHRSQKRPPPKPGIGGSGIIDKYDNITPDPKE